VSEFPLTLSLPRGKVSIFDSFSPRRGEKVRMRGESITVHGVIPLTLPSPHVSGGEGITVVSTPSEGERALLQRRFPLPFHGRG
jgi:hypothetical protein